MKSWCYSRTFPFGAMGQCGVDLQRQSYQPKWPDEGTRGWASERLPWDARDAGKASMVHFCSGALKETTWQNKSLSFTKRTKKKIYNKYIIFKYNTYYIHFDSESRFDGDQILGRIKYTQRLLIPRAAPCDVDPKVQCLKPRQKTKEQTFDKNEGIYKIR